jgi:hypothetical protein
MLDIGTLIIFYKWRKIAEFCLKDTDRTGQESMQKTVEIAIKNWAIAETVLQLNNNDFTDFFSNETLRYSVIQY